MLLEIKKYPDPVLRKKAEKVEKVTEDILELAQSLAETMQKEDGLGLAAPQVGQLKRMIVLMVNKEPKVFLNPVVVKKSKEKETAEEGCLSFPEVFLEIKRPKTVEVETTDVSGERMRISAKGLLACAFQHEIDHLDGILFIDRAGFWQKLKFRFLKK